PVLCLHPLAISGHDRDGFERIVSPPEDPLLLAATTPKLAARELSSQQGEGEKTTDLASLAAQIRKWLSDGLTVILTARVETQTARLIALLEHRDFQVSRALPSVTAPRGATLHVVTSDLARGLVSPLEGFALMTE